VDSIKNFAVGVKSYTKDGVFPTTIKQHLPTAFQGDWAQFKYTNHEVQMVLKIDFPFVLFIICFRRTLISTYLGQHTYLPYVPLVVLGTINRL
jgi:hypothetical protein